MARTAACSTSRPAVLALSATFLMALALSGVPAHAQDKPDQPREAGGEAAAETLSRPADAAEEAARPAQRPLDLAYGAYQRGYFITAFAEATKRLEADPGDTAAMTLLGELYVEGLGARQDWGKAADWFRLASQRGDPQAAYALAMLMLDGKGVAKNPAEARRLLERSADAVPQAATSLGLMLLADQKPESDRRAVELLRRAAQAKDPEALYALAVLTRQGRGVARDLPEAARWMAEAAAERNVAAQVEYAIMLFNGEGVAKDEAAAAKMFTRAAVRGNAVAQNRLARLAAAGRGMPKNMVEAAKWYELSRRQGLTDAWLDNAMKELTPDERRRADEAVAQALGPPR
jgi:TPR repeat protein